MPNRGLIVAVVLLVLLAGGVYWSQRDEEKKAGQPPKDAPPKLLDIPDAQFARVEIRRRAGGGAVLEKQDSGWVLTQTKQLPVDTLAVQSVIATLSSLTTDRLIDEKATNLLQYGFASPQVEVTIARKDGKQHKLLLADDAPTGSTTYAKLDGDTRVFTVPTATKAALDKVWQDLRDRRLLPTQDAGVDRVELTVKGAAYEFTRNKDNVWAIVKPRPLRADNFAVEDLIRHMIEARMEIVPEEDEQTFPVKFAAAAPYATAKLTSGKGTAQLEVRKDRQGDYYAKSSAVEAVAKLSAETADALAKSLDDFRNRKLFDFGFAELSRIDLKIGEQNWSFEKRGEDWYSGGKKLEAGAVPQLVDRLRALTATKLLERGLGRPAAEITVTQAQKKEPEKVIITQEGNMVIASRAGEPGFYELEGSVIDGLRDAAANAKPAP